jgi:hypothetical protein
VGSTGDGPLTVAIRRPHGDGDEGLEANPQALRDGKPASTIVPISRRLRCRPTSRFPPCYSIVYAEGRAPISGVEFLSSVQTFMAFLLKST